MMTSQRKDREMKLTHRTKQLNVIRAALTVLLALAALLPVAGHAGEYGGHAKLHLISETPDIRWKRATLKNFKFILPTGGGWQSKRVDGQIRTHLETRMRNGTVEVHYITVIHNQFPPGRAAWNQKDIADEFRNMEITGMKTLGVNTGQYKLRSAKLGQEKRSGLMLYTLKNLKQGSPVGAGFNEKQNFYMLFADNYAETQDFYIVILGNICFGRPACALSSLSVDGLLPMLTELSFR